MSNNLWHLRNIITGVAECGSDSSATSPNLRTVNCLDCKESEYYQYHKSFRAENKVALGMADAKHDRLQKKLDEFEEEAGERGKEIVMLEKVFKGYKDQLPDSYKDMVKPVFRRFDLRCVKNPDIIKKLLEEPLVFEVV
jgi:hypothetical protein